MSMRILLTGSSGYIARNLIPHLKSLGHFVVGFDRNPPTSDALDDHFRADLLDRRVLGAALDLDGVDAVFHLAAVKADWGLSAAEYFRHNVEATREMLRAGQAKAIKRWVFYSSVACLGPSNEPLDEVAPLSPVGRYGASKARAESLFHGFFAEDGDAEIVIIRPSAVFGPGNPPDANVHRLIDAIYRRRFVMIGKGHQIKTTSYIDNLVAAHMFLMDRMQPGVETFIYVDTPALSTNDLVSRIYHMLGRPRPAWHLPAGLAKPVARLADALAAVTGRDLPITAARIEKFRTGTNFRPAKIHTLGFRQPVSIDDALRATITWYLSRSSELRGGAGASPRNEGGLRRYHDRSQ